MNSLNSNAAHSRDNKPRLQMPRVFRPPGHQSTKDHESIAMVQGLGRVLSKLPVVRLLGPPQSDTSNKNEMKSSTGSSSSMRGPETPENITKQSSRGENKKAPTPLEEKTVQALISKRAPADEQDDLLDTRTPEELREITRGDSVPLGKGGFGHVFKGYDPILGQDVAVKKMGRNAGRRMFSKETGHLSRLRHPNVVHVYAKCEEERAIIMEWQPESLSDRLAAGDISFQRRLELLREVAMGLNYLHRMGIVHHDLKPANVLLTSGDMQPKITDYGLSKNFEADSGDLISVDVDAGTAGYKDVHMAKPASKRDIYSLGVLILVVMGGTKSSQSVVHQALELSGALKPHLDKLKVVESDKAVCCRLVDTRKGFGAWDTVVCRLTLALALSCIGVPGKRPTAGEVETKLAEYLLHLKKGGFQPGPEPPFAGDVPEELSTSPLPDKDRIRLSNQIIAHKKLIKACEAKELNGMEEKEDGTLENRFLLFGPTVYYAYENRVITDEELAHYKNVNNKGNEVKHRIWQDRQSASTMASRVSSIIGAKEPLSQNDPVIRMVRHHHELVRSLTENNIVAEMTKSQQKKVLTNFMRTIFFAKEKQLLSEEGAEKLIKIRDSGNLAKHEQLMLYGALEHGFRESAGDLMAQLPALPK